MINTANIEIVDPNTNPGVLYLNSIVWLPSLSSTPINPSNIFIYLTSVPSTVTLHPVDLKKNVQPES